MKTTRLYLLFQKFLHTRYLFLPFLQLLILFVTILIWLLNRGNAFQKFYSVEEYITSDGAVVTEAVTVDDSTGQGGSFLTTQPLSLKRGIYQIIINYNADQEGSYILAGTDQLNSLEFHSPDAQLNPAYHTTTMIVELTRSVTDFKLEAVFSGSGSLDITDVSVFETSSLYKKNLFYAALLCLFIDLVWLFKRADASGRKVFCALSALFLALCYPLYADFLTGGHDMPFHLLRIEGIAEGIGNGSALPIKIHPLWAKDYGYAVGVLYGDSLLYFPAFLRLLGFSVQASYKYFVAAVNLGSITISYFSFKRMFCSKRVGVFGSMIYCASLYRLMDTYTRGSVGEFCAMMFLPMILCGFYLILTEATEKNWMKYALLTALGLTGLIQAHVLSCEMAAFVILLTCILLIRRIFRRYTFRSLLTAFFLTILLNVGFLIPFLDYYSTDLYITSGQWKGSTVGHFQENGLFPIQLFTLFQRSNGGTWSTQSGIHNEPTTGMGILFLLGILLFGYLALCHFEKCRTIKNFRPACLCLALSCLLLFMSTCLFPWDTFAAWGDTLEKIIYSLEFPWRLLAISTVLLTFVTCFVVSAMPEIFRKETALSIFIAMLFLNIVNCGWYFYDFSFNNEPYRVYDTAELSTMAMYSNDYLPVAVDPALITDNLTIPQNMEVPDAYQKNGTEIICHAATAEKEGYVDFSLNYYKYYTCTDMVTGEQLPVSSGSNGMLRVTFPAGFDSTIRINFTEPWFWRLAEIISLLTLPVCGGIMLIRKNIFGGTYENQKNSN